MITWPIKITENKYSRWYEQFMFNCQKRSTIEGYTEKHHIIPRSLGGTEDKENLVLLTAKEHYIAHALLWKMSMEPKFHNKMSMALHLMVNGSGTKKQHRNYRISARLYQSIRLAKVEAMKSYIAEHGAVWQGRKHKPESIQKIIDANARTKDLRSAKLSGENNGMFGKKHTKDTLLKMSKSNSAAWTDERKQQYSDTVKKLWADLEFKKQMSEIKKNSAGWQNRDWKNIGRKAADARMAKGWKPTEEFKKKISETRRAKMASGEIVPWNKGTKGVSKGNPKIWEITCPEGYIYVVTDGIAKFAEEKGVSASFLKSIGKNKRKRPTDWKVKLIKK